MTHRTFCDGLHRRDMLRLGGASLFGASISLERLAAAEAAGGRNDTSVIIVFLKGGPSHLDMFDLKPDAPAEIRGEFSPISTNVPGTQIGECLPKLAQQMDKLSLIRSFTHHDSGHGASDHYMLTGYFPGAGFNPGLSPNNQKPAHGAVIAKKLGARGAIPPYVCVPKMHPSAGSAYLGPGAAPFTVESDPADSNFQVPDLSPPLALEASRLDQRQRLLSTVDRFQRSADAQANAPARNVNVFRQKAIELMTSAQAKAAFNLSAEPDAVRDAYGRNTLGQCCLLARRLVESGVRCILIDHNNWDTHDNNFNVMKKSLLPHFDQALPTLLTDLSQRGMFEKTMVIVAGEFGRTPRINPNAGRDHWGPCFTVALAGGGIQPGRVVGRSNAWAEKPADTPYGPEDLSATMFHLLDINPAEEFVTPEGRPIALTNRGRLIKELL